MSNNINWLTCDFNSPLARTNPKANSFPFRYLAGELSEQEFSSQSLTLTLVVLPAAASVPPRLTPDQQETCKGAIRSLLTSAGEQNWDGEGADPVTKNTVAYAMGLVKELPCGVGLPEIYADREGNIEFDWHLDNGTMFTISVGKTEDIAVSGLYNGEAKLTGMQWDKTGKVDALLDCGLEWLREMSSR